MSHNIPRELSDVQFVLLGLIFDGEKTGRELRQVLRENYGWDTSTSSFYTYFDRLAAEGLCTVKTLKAGKKFKITAKGKKTFQKKLGFINSSLETWKTHVQ